MGALAVVLALFTTQNHGFSRLAYNREFKIYDAAGSTTRFGNKEICQAKQKL